jgi:pimeloyl-ACP methyl ester carboxylesterase
MRGFYDYRSGCVRTLSDIISVSALLPNQYVVDEIERSNGERKRNVRFVAPLLEYGYRPAVEEYESQKLFDKPLLLYLPGFDGTFLSPFLQFPELHAIFDIRCMTTAQDDRSTLNELQNEIIQYLEFECSIVQPVYNANLDLSNGTNFNATFANKEDKKKIAGGGRSQRRRRPIYLVGESFGGILASLVSILLLQEVSNNFCLKGLTLINAATCYNRSKLAIEGPKVAQLNDWVYPFGLIGGILPLLTDTYSMKQLLLILQSKALPSVIDNACREAYMGRVAFSLPFVLPFMSKETLKWRLFSWLDAGCARLATPEKPLQTLKNLRTLIIVGENDATLPSIAEAERLASRLTNSVVHVVEGAGHASTCGSRVDLAALFRSRFEELRPSKSKQKGNIFYLLQQPKSTTHQEQDGRTSMKEEAAMGKGEYFGMQRRYDNAKIGLNPLRYWSSEYYKKN